MSGRWKIKHDDMHRLAIEARAVLDPARVTYTWMPRSKNKDADRLANEAMDDAAQGRPWRGARAEPSANVAPPSGSPSVEQPEVLGLTEEPAPVDQSAPGERPAGLVWTPPDTGEPTEIVLVRHGQTPLTAERRFSGTGGTDPELSAHGQDQAAALGRLLAAMPPFAVVLSSPLRRARQTADVVAQALGLSVREDEGWTECAFGRWDGLTTAEVAERWPSEHAAWLASTSVAPPGGESFDDVERRVAVARDRLLARYPARRVLVVTHVTPIKQLVRLAVGGGSELLWRLQSDAASVTVTRWWSDGGGTLASFNETSHLRP
jgi:probable phosphoglycerate mutase